MPTCTRRLEWDSMHRIPRHESKCAAFHGHRYAAEITCFSADLDECGRVVDFGVIKELVGAWIDDHWDHTAILQKSDPEPAIAAVAAANAGCGRPVYWLEGAPSAENLVVELARVARELLEPRGVEIRAVRLWETPSSSAEWSAGLRRGQ